MATRLLRNTCLTIVLAAALADPSPGRIPKVYNALITSNQNLEPSKAYPVYQPVLHNTFPFPFHTVYYPVGNSLLPVPGVLPNVPNPVSKPAPQSPSSETPKQSEPSTEAPQPAEEATPQSNPESATSAPSGPPEPPKTESPIPLNEFGLPPQVVPIGHLGPTYDLTHFGSFPYAYPGLRFYDPFDPFAFNPYAALPFYRSIPNIVAHGSPLLISKPESSTAAPVSSNQEQPQNPPEEPSDLNVLNYSAKDPAIPNVPPPPLPSGGLKSDKSE